MYLYLDVCFGSRLHLQSLTSWPLEFSQVGSTTRVLSRVSVDIKHPHPPTLNLLHLLYYACFTLHLPHIRMHAHTHTDALTHICFDALCTASVQWPWVGGGQCWYEPLTNTCLYKAVPLWTEYWNSRPNQINDKWPCQTLIYSNNDGITIANSILLKLAWLRPLPQGAVCAALTEITEIRP